MLFALVGVAGAQEVDIAVGGTTLFSAQPTSASQAFQPPAEKGGLYPSARVQYIRKDRLGFNGEFSWRYKESLYNGFQRYRPVLYDVNAVFAPTVSYRTKVDLMAGVGGQTSIFYNTFRNCGANSGVCTVHLNSTHIAAHLGIDLRRYVWRNLFVSPEVHYYRIINNSEYHSDNVLRMGASLGYSWGRH